MYNYFISYQYINDTGFGFGFGNGNIKTKFPIRTIEDVREIEAILRKENSRLKSLTLNNWKELEKEKPEKRPGNFKIMSAALILGIMILIAWVGSKC